MKITDNGRPYGIFDCSLGAFSNQKPDPKKFYIREGLIFLILLLVPAINLSSMTQSRLRRYITEIGIRRPSAVADPGMLTDIVTGEFHPNSCCRLYRIALLLSVHLFQFDLVFANITDYLFNSYGHHSVNFSLLFSPTVFLFALLSVSFSTCSVPLFQHGRLLVPTS